MWMETPAHNILTPFLPDSWVGPRCGQKDMQVDKHFILSKINTL